MQRPARPAGAVQQKLKLTSTRTQGLRPCATAGDRSAEPRADYCTDRRPPAWKVLVWGSDAIEQMLVEIPEASTPAPKVRTPEILLPLGRTPVTRVLSFDYIGAILRVYTRSSALFVAPSLRILWPVAAPLLAVTFVFARRVLVSIAHIFALPKLVPPRPALQVRPVRLRQSCWRLDLWDGDGQPKAKWEEQEGPGRHGALIVCSCLNGSRGRGPDMAASRSEAGHEATSATLR